MDPALSLDMSLVTAAALMSSSSSYSTCVRRTRKEVHNIYTHMYNIYI